MNNYDFAYHNVNPHKIEGEDCVTRAISLATKLPYASVANLLNMSEYYYDCDKLTVNCYGRLLSEVFNYPERTCYKGETVGDIVNKYPYNTLIIRINGHLTCSVLGILTDIWNCADKKVDRYWIIS
jgi:hypothetical protein